MEVAVSEQAVESVPKQIPSPPRVDRLPPYRVLLHNDDVNSFEHVISSITEITHHGRAAAFKLTLEAHLRGVSLIAVAHRERAELYQDQFRSKSLTVTIEPAE